MADRINRDELRALIREALKEALGDAASVPHPRSGGGGPPKAVEGASDVLRPSIRPLHHASHGPPHPSTTGEEPRASGGSLRIDSGVLTEAKVAEAARAHSKIQVGAGVAITPLARDKARELKMQIERLKP